MLKIAYQLGVLKAFEEAGISPEELRKEAFLGGLKRFFGLAKPTAFQKWQKARGLGTAAQKMREKHTRKLLARGRHPKAVGLKPRPAYA